MRRGRATGVVAPTADGYAPFDLVTDPALLGLARETVETAHGRTIVHHAASATDPSARRRATVMLHGAAGSWTTWTPLLQAAREVDALVSRPVLIDLPGWGDSPEPDPGLDVESAAAVVVEVAEALGVTEFDLVGHSMGAFIALHLAATRPDLVLSVSVVSATSFSAIDAVSHPVRGLDGPARLDRLQHLQHQRRRHRCDRELADLREDVVDEAVEHDRRIARRPARLLAGMPPARYLLEGAVRHRRLLGRALALADRRIAAIA